MKTIIAFVAGLVLAAGMVYILMRPDHPAGPPPAETTIAVPKAVEPEAEAPSPVNAEPERIAPEPRAVAEERPRGGRTAATAPRRETVARAERAPRAETPAAVAVPTPTPAPSTPAPQSAPAEQVASNPIPAPPAEPMRIEEPKPVRVPQTVTIPAGTLLSVRVDQTLTSATTQPGDSFRATLDQPLTVDGFVIAERGARVEGRVVESDPGGRVQGQARISLELVRLSTADGQRVRLQTESFAKSAEKSTKRDVAKVGAAAGIGAAIGAIAGGGKGAAVGAVVGGAAGTGGVMATRGSAAEIPAETRMTFRLRDAITITEKLK